MTDGRCNLELRTGSHWVAHPVIEQKVALKITIQWRRRQTTSPFVNTSGVDSEVVDAVRERCDRIVHTNRGYVVRVRARFAVAPNPPLPCGR